MTTPRMLPQNNQPNDIQEKHKKLLHIINSMVPINDSTSDREILNQIFHSRFGFKRQKLNLTNIIGKSTQGPRRIDVFWMRQHVNETDELILPIIKVKYDDRAVLLRPITPQHIQELFTLLVSMGAVEENTFGTYENSKNKEFMGIDFWQKRTVNQIYNPIVSLNYQTIHSVLADLFKEYFAHSPIGLNQTEAKSALFISAACGNGRDLETIQACLSQNNLNIYKAGFDVNADNVKSAQQKHQEGYFFSAEIKDLSQNIAKIKEWFFLKTNQQPDHLAVIFSGILQRRVISGTWEASQYLQTACRLADMVLMASKNGPLTNSTIAHAIGFSVISRSYQKYDVDNTVANDIAYALTKQTAEERFSYLIKRSDKRSPYGRKNNIDLSLSANPLSDLKLILTHCPERFKETTQLDLSWSFMEEAEIDQVMTLIKNQMPSLKTILIATVEPWAAMFLNQLSTSSYLFYKRNDAVNTFEVPEMSVQTARFLKMFSQLPCEKITVTGDLELKSAKSSRNP